MAMLDFFNRGGVWREPEKVPFLRFHEEILIAIKRQTQADTGKVPA
jgi:hypothetical protein